MTRDWKIRNLAAWCILVATAGPAAAADEPLGRMFFTPTQRAQLDVARTQRARTTLATETIDQEVVATAAPVEQHITYDGAVRRSDGKTTVWLNNRPVHDKEAAGGAVVVGRVRPDGGVSLLMPQSGRSVNLKPGQSVELLSGLIEERFSRKPAAPSEPKPESKPAPKPVAEAKAAVAPERATAEREDRERQNDESLRAQRNAAARPPATSAAPAEAPR